MAISKEKKRHIAERLRTMVAEAPTLVFVHFHGLAIPEEKEMRDALKEAGVRYFVAKKTLIRRALEEANIAGTMPPLEGEIALAYGEDALAPAREVYAFVKKHPESLAIAGGIFEGEYRDAEAMTAIAQIPSLPQLRGMFVNVIHAPLQGLAVALHALAEQREAQQAA